MSNENVKKVQIEAVEEPTVMHSDVEAAPPATIYDVVMANMTPDTLADLGVKLISVNNSELYWVTSAGQLYGFNARAQALAAERAWLGSKAQ